MLLREEAWPDEIAWLGTDDKGYFTAPRSLPVILRALSSKKVSGNKDVGPTYLELLSRHWDGGVVEMTHEEDHAFGAGYGSTKTWRDRMLSLEQLGFIKIRPSGHRSFAQVLLVHPSLAMQGLRNSELIDDKLWNAYRDLQRLCKERTAEQLLPPEELDDTVAPHTPGAAAAWAGPSP